ncbi:hypothetical protein PR048_032990 [Dryococelus australis]|uniref:Reverse transcriptase domain-containing protein n=1 Tax=Dryococelus australis TaxID=614101 RepID=A0ABQ9G3T1_9NEOP|nr:hypothetical protein PR048_032990 [Dryococelus australis]
MVALQNIFAELAETQGTEVEGAWKAIKDGLREVMEIILEPGRDKIRKTSTGSTRSVKRYREEESSQEEMKGYVARIYLIKLNGGNHITYEEIALEEWKRYFEELLSSSTNVIDENGDANYQNVQPWVVKPITEEVRNAIKSMKRSKATGIDGIKAEILQEGKTGVKQGGYLSPLLFNPAPGKAIKRVAEMETGLQIGRKENILAYADDVVLKDKNKEELRDMMKVLVKQFKEVGLEINIEKTKYLHINLKYLGGLLNERNIVEKEILTRLQTGNRFRFSMGKMLKFKSRTSKLRI